MLRNGYPSAISRAVPPLVFAALVVLLLAPLALPAQAQDLHPTRRPSPMSMARTFVGDAYVSVVYSRPYLRGREGEIFGAGEDFLVPYGELWRTGANEATEITVTGDVMIGGERLPAGTYSLFTTPGEESWKLHFNSRLGLSGTFYRDPETGDFEQAYSAENDVLTLTVPAGTAEEEVDQFTISFEAAEDDATHMVLAWDTTEVRVPIRPAG